MAYFNIESRLMGIKMEAVAGVEETLTSSDFDIRLHELSMGDIAIEFDGMSKIANGNHTHGLEVPGVASGGASATVKLARGVFNYTASVYDDYQLPYSKFLRASGLGMQVIEPTDDLTEDGKFIFVPATDYDLQPVTLNVLDVDSETGNGNKYSLYGAMGAMTVEMETGKPILFKTELNGGVGSVSTVLSGVIPEYTDASALSTIPKPMLNVVVTVTELNNDGTDMTNGTVKEFCLETATLDPGNGVSAIKCQSTVAGIRYFAVKTRKPTIKLKPQLESLEDFDYWASMKTSGSWKIEILGEDFELDVPRAQIMAATLGDTDGSVDNELTFNAMTNLQGVTSYEKQNDYKITIFGNNVLA